MRQQDPTDTRGRRQLAHGRPVEMIDTIGDRTRPERDLAQQRVAGLDERSEVGGLTAVARIDETLLGAWRPNPECVAFGRVRDETGLHVKVAQDEWTFSQVGAVQRLGREAGLGVEGVEAARESGRSKDPQPPGWLEAVSKVMAKGDQIDEVIGMEVADDDRVESARVELADNPWKRSLAKVEEDRGRAMANEVRGPGGTGSIRVRRPGPCDEQLERSLLHPGILRGRCQSALGDAPALAVPTGEMP
jgi:hypothetical protein